ncbi:MAG: spore germination protein [Selenomonadales bacterium]|nr:spore germination protein [Selenomonadales bacterium]
MTKRRLRKPLSVARLRRERSRENSGKAKELDLKVPPPRPVEDEKDEPLALSLDENLHLLKLHLGGSDDVVFRDFRLGNASALRAAVVFIDGLTNKDQLQRDLLSPLMIFAHHTAQAECESGLRGFAALKSHLLTVMEVKDVGTVGECVLAVLSADTVLLLDRTDTALVIGARTWEHRPIMEAVTERGVRGPRDGFNELFKSNIALVRQRMKTPSLRVKFACIGRRSQTNLAILYDSGLASPAILTELYKRLSYIDVDGILDSGYIEQYIEDSPYSPFPQVQFTERPDRVAAAIMEGRVALIVDGTPFAILVPSVLSNFLPTSEDHYERWLVMTGVRFVRAMSIIMAVLLPALYVAVTTFHQEMIPSQLALTIAGARAGVPFPAVVEALMMEVTFELLREGGIRVPGTVGTTIGIVGGIIIGQAAVTAGLVSPVMVVVVALTAIGSFAVPAFNVGLSLRLLRFPLILLAGTLGLYGVLAGVIAVVLHLVSLKSFGVPYLSPLAPSDNQGLKDTLIRAPLWAQLLRPGMFEPRQKRRIGRPAYVQHPPGGEDDGDA